MRIAKDGSTWSTKLVYRRSVTTPELLNMLYIHHLRFRMEPAPRAKARRR